MHTEADIDFHKLNLVYALRYGLINWAQYFELWRKLDLYE